MSKANLLYIYAACQQSDMQVNNLIWGRDAAYLREIENIIGPEGVQMARWLTKAYAEMRKTLDPISREISGMPTRGTAHCRSFRIRCPTTSGGSHQARSLRS